MKLIFLLLCSSVYAATYYVDATLGNDAAAGSSAAPWLTLARAYTWYAGAGDKVVDGDTVLFRNGSYGEFEEDAHDGAAYHFHRTNWITYKADTGCSPVLTNIQVENFHPGTTPPGMGVSYLSFDGFTITADIAYAPVYVSYTQYFKLLNCTITKIPDLAVGANAPYFSSGATGAAIYMRTCDYVTITGNDISNCCKAMSITSMATDEHLSTDYTITDNTIHDFAGDGIAIGAGNITLDGNYLYDFLGVLHSNFIIRGTVSDAFDLGETVQQAGTGATGIVVEVGSAGVGKTVSVFVNSVAGFTVAGGTVTGLTSGETVTDVSTLDAEHVDGFEVATTAEIIRTDLASVDPWTTITSATGGFTSEMVGRSIYIYGAGTNFTIGTYVIASRVDTNTITVTAPCGSVGNASGGSGRTPSYHSTDYTITNNKIIADFTEFGAIGTDGWLVNGALKVGSQRPNYVENVVIENNVVYGYQNLWASLEGSIKINNNTFMCIDHVYHTSADTNCIIDEYFNNLVSSLIIGVDANGGITNFVAHGNNIFGDDPDGRGGASNPYDINGTESVSQDFSAAYFTNYATFDFTLAAGSTAINFGNASYDPATDILGNSRIGLPDAGAYEYGADSRYIIGTN